MLVVERFADAVAQLRTARTTAQLLETIPPAVISLGFERVMISSVEDDVWRPHAVRIEADEEWGDLVEESAQHHPQLIASTVPERHAIRHRSPVLVPPPRDVHVWSKQHWEYRHPRTVTAYIASPVTRNGEVVGIVHADLGTTCRRLDYRDVSLLWSFCGMADLALTAAEATEGRGGSTAAASSGWPAASSGPRPDRLTPREQEVVELVAQGLTNAQIGERLRLAEGTVKSHVKHVLAKTGSTNRTAAALAWADRRPSGDRDG